MDGQQIQINNTIKIFGVTFDKRWSRTNHINDLKNALSSRLNVIKILAHTSWESKTHVLMKVYKYLILSKLNYGSFMWATANKSLTKKLDIIHNSELRLSSGAFRSCPISSIHNFTGIPSLNIRRLKLTLNQELKLASSKPSPNFTFNLKTIQELFH